MAPARMQVNRPSLPGSSLCDDTTRLFCLGKVYEMLEKLRKVRKSLEKQVETLREKTEELKELVDSQAD